MKDETILRREGQIDVWRETREELAEELGYQPTKVEALMILCRRYREDDQ